MYTEKVRQVVSRAAQEHAFALGWKWRGSGEKEAQEMTAPYVYFGSDGYLMYGTDSRCYSIDNNHEITAEGFLNLTKESLLQKTLDLCPFCGKGVAEIFPAEDASNQFHVVCNFKKGGCGASSGYASSLEGAVDKWNTRKGTEEDSSVF